MEKLIDIITVDDFKTQFPRFSPMYLPIYNENKTYFKNDIVYFNEQFYICIVESTNNNPTITTDWNITNQDVLNYTQDEDILNAYREAYVNFNQNLFEDKATAILLFLYLTAHYLTVDFNNALGINNVGIPTSKSVGSVSESYTIPQWLTENAGLSMYATTGYGIKYATMLKPFLVGNVFIVNGAISF